MNLIENILSTLGLCSIENSDYKITIIGKEGIYFEGIEKIEIISSNSYKLKSKKTMIFLEGDHLSICKYYDHDIGIKGLVTKLEIL